MKPEIKLNAMKHEYVNPSPDRVVDQKVNHMVANYCIARINANRVLELGAGDRIWTPKLLKRAEHVTTVEGSSELLSIMKQEIKDAHWNPVHSLFESFKPAERFDAVYATYILEHVHEPMLILNLAKEQWLKPGGTLVVVVPHALSIHRRHACTMGLQSFPGQIGEMDNRLGHEKCFTVYEMEELLVRSGFEIIEKKGMFTKPFPNSMLTHCSDVQLQGLFDLGLEMPIEYSAVIFFSAQIK